MIRKARLDDLESLVAGNLALALESEKLQLDENSVRSGVQAVLDGARSAVGQYYALEENGQIVAQLLVTHEWSDWRNCVVWWIQSVYVKPEERRRGLFKELYDQVLEDAQASGAAGIRLYVDRHNVRAQAVYEALGLGGEHYRLYEKMFDARPKIEAG